MGSVCGGVARLHCGGGRLRRQIRRLCRAYKWRAVITSKGDDAFKVSVKVTSTQPHCLGEIEAVGRLQAGRIVTQPPNQGDSCVLTISRSDGGITVVEQACSVDHGTSCEFTSRMTRAKR
jgi:hypothetical protein